MPTPALKSERSVQYCMKFRNVYSKFGRCTARGLKLTRFRVENFRKIIVRNRHSDLRLNKLDPRTAKASVQTNREAATILVECNSKGDRPCSVINGMPSIHGEEERPRSVSGIGRRNG